MHDAVSKIEVRVAPERHKQQLNHAPNGECPEILKLRPTVATRMIRRVSVLSTQNVH